MLKDLYWNNMRCFLLGCLLLILVFCKWFKKLLLLPSVAMVLAQKLEEPAGVFMLSQCLEVLFDVKDIERYFLSSPCSPLPIVDILDISDLKMMSSSSQPTVKIGWPWFGRRRGETEMKQLAVVCSRPMSFKRAKMAGGPISGLENKRVKVGLFLEMLKDLYWTNMRWFLLGCLLLILVLCKWFKKLLLLPSVAMVLAQKLEEPAGVFMLSQCLEVLFDVKGIKRFKFYRTLDIMC
ncbi:hypothetical protein LINGRAHAP2_LOCUS12554 [Linum grandiflorum]